MALLICKYLRLHSDKRIRDSFDLFLDFVYREFYDENTGEVFNTIGKNRDMIRLYNAPWLMMLFGEVYFLTGNKTYLTEAKKHIRVLKRFSGHQPSFHLNEITTLIFFQ